MFYKKSRIKVSFWLVLSIILLSACGEQKETIQNHYYLLLSGESESWKLDSYEMVLTPETFKAGDGELTMKNKEELSTDTFSLKAHANIDGQDRVIQARAVTGSESDITNTITGSGGGTYYNNEGNPVSFEDISQIYLTVTWTEDQQTKEERIDLYRNEEAFQSNL